MVSSSPSNRRILVTSALPYANGPIHLGHLVEYLQTDIWVRFQKLIGNRCVYMCADDTHGTAVMISAQKAGIKEETLIAQMQASHERDFADFDIQFDNYGSTHSQENRVLCEKIWQSIRAAGLVKQRDVEQLFDPGTEVVTYEQPLWQRFILAAMVLFLLDLLVRRVRIFDRGFKGTGRRVRA